MGGNNADDVAARAEKKLKEILTAWQSSNTLPADFRKWFLQHFSKNENSENSALPLEKFAVFYLNAVRQQTYQHLRTTETTNENILPQSLLQRDEQMQNNKSNVSTTPTIQDVNYQNTPISSRKCSTPLRCGGMGQRRSIERSLEAASNSSFEKSRNSTGGGSFCLGDFIISSPNVSGGGHGHGSHKKKQSHHTQHAILTAERSGASAAASTTKSTVGGGSKPKKRVVPISIGGCKTTTHIASAGECNSPFGVHGRSFERDCNNLFMNTPTMEVTDLAEARKSLKRDLNEVSTAFKAATTPTKTSTKVSEVTQTMQQMELNTVLVDETTCLLQISNETRCLLRLLANIYGLLMDMNFVINILNEFSFLMNLLNTPNVSISKNYAPIFGLQMLQLSVNSIYFAVCVLEIQQHTLTQLDTKSLNVVLQCERLDYFAPLLKAKLSAAYEQKQSLAYQLEHQQTTTADSSFKNVYFQENSDSRKFFSSTAEFGAFKTQRDLFYNVLKLWENYHLNPAWSFNSELAPKVREIFRQSEHPVNMAHFAKLFVSQLLISASYKTSPEDLGFGNNDVDVQKFNKLAQRLVTPSSFSVDYQFPREQAFFRDFIVESHSLPFMEHLKMVIFAELITLNDSTLEHLNLNLMTPNEESDYESHERSEFVVEPNVLSSMLILAKFFGFVSALPYQGGATATGTSSESQNTLLIQRYQLKMRQIFCAPFDVCELLDVAMKNGRLLITLPWLVQYMAMLDAVTLQLSSFVKALQQMFALYAAIGGARRNEADPLLAHSITPMSSFIVRCCLGWLFEQKPGIAAEYYNFRTTMYHASYDAATPLHTLNTFNKSSLVQLSHIAVLESLLAVACPYLAEFRVSIMPAKHALTKYVSRSGRYRHITPSIAEAPNDETSLSRSTAQQTNQNTQTLPMPMQPENNNAMKQRQRRLMESFLHAQNSSMRRLLVFLTERTYKCVVKDAQHQILLPSKAFADSCVNEINSDNYETVYSEVQSIYRAARADAIQQWDNAVPSMLRKRVTQGLDALLPVETTSVVKMAYAWRIQSDANIKIAQWRHMNLFMHDFYCNDLDELAEKLCKANKNRPKQTNTGSGGGGVPQSTELKLIKAKPSISDVLEELQHWLYITSGMSNLNLTPEQCPTSELKQHSTIDEALIDYLARLIDSFENVLPTIYYRLIGAGLIQVFHHLIATQPAALTPALIETFCNFCMDERMRNADERITIATTPQFEETKNVQITTTATDSTSSYTSTTVTTIYHALITAPFLQSLNGRNLCFEKLKALISSMIQTKIISIDFVNELFIGVFKHDLCPGTLNETSRLLSELVTFVDSQDIGDDDTQKSKLFMEVLAEFSRDIDF